MPILARKLNVAKLPVELVLTNNDALMIGRRLSDVSTVQVVARLSSSGSATPQQGDWQAVSAPGDISSGKLKLALKIDKPYRP